MSDDQQWGCGPVLGVNCSCHERDHIVSRCPLLLIGTRSVLLLWFMWMSLFMFSLWYDMTNKCLIWYHFAVSYICHKHLVIIMCHLHNMSDKSLLHHIKRTYFAGTAIYEPTKQESNIQKLNWNYLILVMHRKSLNLQLIASVPVSALS